ncbi:hypothetical protein JYU29_17325 [Tianweitania sp. BSSL-BM11]|uniref:Uncharacterized protein n=1 Tax=Tianweitania aestuarii TaxID=2814886 RepID=A0ABS5RZK0_9HYPH|nr:hypothetical protein [Tianweitania aestuarii]MBS9722458.1 hypothetical protein [Tianweitania aestuarii]
MPEVSDFRVQVIQRTGSETQWPFTIERGNLLCAKILGQPVVYFSEQAEDENDQVRVAQVSVNPFDLGFGNLGDGGLVKPDMSMKERIAAMGPLLTVGRRLCDQPRGTAIGPGEL